MFLCLLRRGLVCCLLLIYVNVAAVFKCGVVNWFGFVEFVFVAGVVGDSSVNGCRELFENVGRMV